MKEELTEESVNSVRFVPASGSGECGLMIIGEAPGQEEDEQGKPFVGRSGKLLDKLLAYIGLDRDKIYITNIVKVRPSNNRTPTPLELESWKPLLYDEIDKVAPKLIVTLGNCSTKSVLGIEEGITKVRGRIFPFRDYKVLPTYHPSFLLRKSGNLEINRQVKEDLKLIDECLRK